MKAILITYTTEKLTPTQRSILSKRINGYTDKSNKSQYTYTRKGKITTISHIKITQKTFIVKKEDSQNIMNLLKKHKATVKSWEIGIENI